MPRNSGRVERTRSAQSFFLNSLAPELRPRAERILLQMLDSAALYTLIGGIKPMSGFMASFIRHRISLPRFNEFSSLRRPLQIIETERQILAALFPGSTIFATVHASPDPEHLRSDRVYAFGLIAHRVSLASAITRHQGFFAPYLITPSSHPLEAILAAVHDASPSSARALGYLVGYPDYAVDFWLESRAQERATGRKVPRAHIRVPTYSKRSNFAWAVPKGHRICPDDQTILDRAAAILDAYRQRRRHYIGKGRPGPAALLDDCVQNLSQL